MPHCRSATALLRVQRSVSVAMPEAVVVYPASFRRGWGRVCSVVVGAMDVCDVIPEVAMHY